jgi:hypothetical protein
MSSGFDQRLGPTTQVLHFIAVQGRRRWPPKTVARPTMKVSILRRRIHEPSRLPRDQRAFGLARFVMPFDRPRSTHGRLWWRHGLLRCHGHTYRRLAAVPGCRDGDLISAVLGEHWAVPPDQCPAGSRSYCSCAARVIPPDQRVMSPSKRSDSQYEEPCGRRAPRVSPTCPG